MVPKKITFESEFYTNSEILPDLTAYKIRDILLISSLYNIFNLEEGGILASRLDNEYKGLRLENPPRIQGVSSADEALALLKIKDFDMVLIVPHLDRNDPSSLGLEIKRIKPKIPVILLSQNTRELSILLGKKHLAGIDGIYRWFGNSNMLLAIVKNAEDHKNVEHDTMRANVRVLVLVEDSPDYYSYLLPIFYREVVNQTNALMEVGLTEKQRSLTLRQRPKILLARSYEEGLELCTRYRSYLLCLVSDTRLPKEGVQSADAGFKLLLHVREAIPDLPLLMMSSESANKEKAEQNGIMFLDKESPNILKRIHAYFLDHLGFGDFIFRMPNGMEVDRAPNFKALEEKLKDVPNKSVAYHAEQHHFSRWVMARSEISLAIKFRSLDIASFKDIESLRTFLITNINSLRKYRQKGVVSKFDKRHFDADIRQFVKTGNGALGGKARGLAFISDLFRQNDDLQKKFPGVSIKVPKTLVLCTDLFDAFVSKNNLRSLLRKNLTDEEVEEHFINARLPDNLLKNLYTYLKQATYPLSVRSSSQMEDAHYHPYAGIYRTYKIPNNHPELPKRLEQLIKAIKLVYASTYFKAPRSYSRSTSNQHAKESMAVIIQEVAGQQYGDYYYPTFSGIAQSFNYYPYSRMKAEEGVVHMALGLGKTVVDGGKCIRFSPRHPDIIPEFSLVRDILKNSQQSFYALKTRGYPSKLNFRTHSNLEKRNVFDAGSDFPVQSMSSTYIPGEDRIRDTWDMEGPKVLTFARVLKYNLYQIPQVLSVLLDMTQKGFGCPVEIEFSVNIYPGKEKKMDFFFLQARPMFTEEEHNRIEISDEEKNQAFCRSAQALGNGISRDMADIVFIKPESFEKNATQQIAQEIERVNNLLEKEKRPYLLVGPGRWGGSDRWLGIPVKWHQISNVGAIVELRNKNLDADPSQGSHFFSNITSLGIHYIMLDELNRGDVANREEFFDWDWLNALPVRSETRFIRHVSLDKSMVLKIDGKTSRCVIIKP
jgi:pyruvate phosphate dikinase-like enzyme